MICHFLEKLYSTKPVNFTYFCLQGYSVCIYMHFQNPFNILTSSAKIMEKSAYSASQSEISAAVLAVKMEHKISQDLYNVSLSDIGAIKH